MPEQISGKKSTRPAFLRYMHYFRAFAILNITAVHIWHVPTEYLGAAEASMIADMRWVAFHSSTIYFIFISGFLFHYLSYNFKVKKYYFSKLKYVLSPFLVWSVAIVSIELAKGELKDPQIGHLVQDILLGRIQVQYWYIPFIALVFLISPLLLRIPKHIFGKITIIGCFLPLLGTRTTIYVTVWQYIYFLPIYLLGMYFAMNMDRCVDFIRRFLPVIVFLFVVSTFGLILVDPQLKYAFVHPTESLHYIHKLSFSFIAILVLRKLESKKIRVLDLLANYSFALYFSHMYIAYFLMDRFYEGLLPVLFDSLLSVSIVFTVTIIFLSLGISMVQKKILGRYSRLLIGA